MLNLLTNSWIPVRRTTGTDVIRPAQIAEEDVLFPDWPRPDLNLACLELLVGLVYIAAPPEDAEDWLDRKPDPVALQRALDPLALAFELLGDGPRFLQDLERIEGTVNPPDMLFIDSAGAQAARKNTDLMVKRSRYSSLPLPLAAMALYTLQNFAPAGGAGMRTSMRGGGPMVTLVRPDVPGLWPLIWANVPFGQALDADELDELPWMRPTRVSDQGQVTVPPEGWSDPHPELFFGMPRRLRLTADESGLTAVNQVPRGTNYAGWVHPLSPYYLTKTEKLPKHPKPGGFGYRNWRGILLQSEGGERPGCLNRWLRVRPGERARLLVGGWAMSNATPLDFIWSEQPVFSLNADAETRVADLVEAAEQAAYALAINTRAGKGEDDTQSGAAARARQAFFARTQAPFEDLTREIADGRTDVAEPWLTVLRRTALALFDAEVMPGLADLQESRRRKAVDARRNLVSSLSGYGGIGKKIFTALGLELPKRKKETA
ncbi:type I-E CRISPR-associated protein Cse1/CasA [Palleronia caenipelagi]|uniref:Type I-E CRISPR-associated protein Cse1/CasA n=1 Tax=Palleronia caenipelagi TaxID=2489174 RepID=A0A547PMK4_9RHOB|nr:type I-E CRISPR-associated protein Cse1/CasA [Palleronia caenipelagi]TRD15378.1 type I-E CRISPR-associated protein Cse1/CasA [Palleronia caenipelagi]